MGLLVRVPVNGVVLDHLWVVDGLGVVVAVHRVAKLVHDILLDAGASSPTGGRVGREEFLVGPSLCLLGQATLRRHRGSCLVTPIHLAIVVKGGVSGEGFVVSVL